jgi:hypothetical protein
MSGRVPEVSDGFTTGDGQETYSIFARFRRNRLALMRRVSLEDALKFIVKLRAERFHDPDGVFIVSDRTGNTVDERRLEAPARPDGRGDAVVVVEGTPEGAPMSDRLTAEDVEVRRYVRPPSDASELHRRAHSCLETTGRAMAQLNASVIQLQELLEDIHDSAAGIRRRH